MVRRTRSSDSGRNQSGGLRPRRQDGARSDALRLLSRRDYTTYELRSKLADREYESAVIASLIDDLTSSGLLDDRRVAAAHVRTASRVKSRGRLRIARELSARGIPKPLITEALGAVGAGDELEAIRKILLRKRWPSKPSLQDRRRMFQHLMRRGFQPHAIGKALGGEIDE